DYTHPERNQYAFKLDGFDDEWVTGGNRRFARYMNLDPGEYVFRVKGSNNDGVWNERGSELHITILPPFWKTWWFYSISAVAFFGSLAAFYNHRVKEKVRRLTELERVRDEENKKVRKRAADDFHDEFGHKLTKISLLGQVMKRTTNGGSSELTEHLTKIIQTSNELSMGMRDFLWTLNPDKDSAYDVAIRLKDFGDELFNSTGIGFRVASLSKDLETVRPGIDWRRHVTLMFKEAMNNAAKHSACRNVSLEIAVKNELVEIRLADDGKGFDVGRSTAGQGLYSMQHRAEKIHGTLNIASQHDKGTIVEFIGEAPVDPAAKQGGATR
ncbi:MAG TPA: triple tyrosine motif-containing protein, partial [Bacteroidota bacterium]|nr:triple tyrosine motif-containing protein [Bacteroidota bacterium]